MAELGDLAPECAVSPADIYDDASWTPTCPGRAAARHPAVLLHEHRVPVRSSATCGCTATTRTSTTRTCARSAPCWSRPVALPAGEPPPRRGPWGDEALQLTSTAWPACSSSSSMRPIRPPGSGEWLRDAGLELDERHLGAGDDAAGRPRRLRRAGRPRRPAVGAGRRGDQPRAGRRPRAAAAGARRRLPDARDLPRRPAARPGRRRHACGPGIDGPEVGALLVAKRDAADADPVFGPLPLSPDVHPVPPRRDLRAARRARRCWPAARCTPTRPSASAGTSTACSSTSRRRRRSSTSGPSGDVVGVAASPCDRRDDLPRCSDAAHPDIEEVWAPFAGRFADLVRARARAGGLTRDDAGRGGDPAPRRWCGWSGSASRTASAPPGCCPTPRWGCGTSSATSRPTPRPVRWWPPSPGPATPTSPLRSLHRLVEALDRADPQRRLRRRRCSPACAARACCAAGCSRSSAPAPGWPTTSPPTPADWTVLDDDGDGVARGADRPSARRAASGRCWPPSAPTPTTRRGACGWARRAPDASPERVARAPAGLPARDPLPRRPRPRRRRCPPRTSPPSWPTSPPPCSPPGWPSPSPSSRRRPPPAGWPSSPWARPAAASSTTSATSTSSSSPSRSTRPTPRARRCQQRHPRRRRPHADLPRGGLGGRRRAAPGGQGRRRWSAPSPGTQAYYEQWASTWEFQALLKMRPVAGDPDLGRGLRRHALAAGLDGRRPARLRRRGAGDAPAGRGQHPARPGRAGAQARPRRAARRRVRRPAAADGARAGRPDAAARRHAAGAAGAVGRRLRRPGRRRDADRLLPVPAHRRAPAPAAAAAPHPPAAHRRAAAALAGPLAGLQARRPGRRRRRPATPSWRCTPARCGGCTRSSSTGRCCRRWPGCPASTCSSGSKAAGDWLRALGLRRPRGRAAAPRRAHRRGLPVGVDAEVPAAGPAADLRRPARTPTPGCWPTGRSARRSAATSGSCGCCATRGRWPSGWPSCSAPASTSPRC